MDEDEDSDDDDWEDMSNWSPEELCRSAEGTVVFSDVNLRADTAPTAVLFQQVRFPQPEHWTRRACFHPAAQCIGFRYCC